MSDATVPRAGLQAEVSTLRLFLMRALYLLIAVALGADVWPRLLGAGESLGTLDGVAYSFWAALSLLAVLGLRYPLKMLPLLLIQLVYKSIWLLAVAWPARWAGTTDEGLGSMTEVFVVGVLLDLLVIPWPYVYRTLALAPGDPWKAIRPGRDPGRVF
jgi:hypothetical protein